MDFSYKTYQNIKRLIAASLFLRYTSKSPFAYGSKQMIPINRMDFRFLNSLLQIHWCRVKRYLIAFTHREAIAQRAA